MLWLFILIVAVAGVFLFIKFGLKKIPDPTVTPEAELGSRIIPPPATQVERATSVLNHIQQWAEAYWWIPISLLGVVLFSKFSFFLTQRKPLDNGFDWPGLGQKFFVCVLLILLLSIRKEAGGVWLTKQEQIENPQLAWKEAATQTIMAIIFAYLLTHV